MTDSIWEPLAELELNLSGSKSFQIYCLCSRAFIFRNKFKSDTWEVYKEKFENDYIEKEPVHEIYDHDNQVESPNLKKQEIEATSCYCSASHYSTDDYESVMQSTSDHQSTSKDQFLVCPLQNSDSGADLSENCIEKSVFKVSDISEVVFNYSKSTLEAAWEKFWSENGESIIWKSWIEKYGAYINPNYLEQNLLKENIDLELNEISKEQNVRDCKIDSENEIPDIFEDGFKSADTVTVKQESNCTETILEKIPDLKISSYPSCGSLIEAVDIEKSNIFTYDSDSEEKILKSNSFGSYTSYEKVKSISNDYDKLKNNDSERVRSRCSNTNLSVRSIANTTVTTDSMTNVTKITLSSLDLSCECESVKSSSLLSSSSDDSSRPSSTSPSSSKEEMCTEADLWWRKVWKEHYEDQYTSSYQAFIKSFDQDGNSEADHFKTLNECLQRKFFDNSEEQLYTEEKNNAVISSHLKTPIGSILPKLNKRSLEFSPGYSGDSDDQNQFLNTLPEVMMSDSNKSPVRSDNLKRQLGNSDDSFDDVEEVESVLRKKSFQKKCREMGKSTKGKVDNVNQALALMGYSFKPDSCLIQSGHVTYKKKNIRGQNRRLILCETKPKTHLFFDDKWNLMDSKATGFSDVPQPLNEDEKVEEDLAKIDSKLAEPESLGYEAHSSSVEDVDTAFGDNKKQKKKKKRQRKYSLPQEILDNKHLLKYWFRRYHLFSRFDKGIKLDAESWFSVTPEKLAKHHAERCRCDVIIDAFCGAGGNAIQFAFTCEKVIALDIDPIKIEMARNNAKIYGVEDRIEFIVGDFIALAPKLHADVVFLSPPWGGPEYVCQEVYNLDKVLPPVGGKVLYDLASQAADNVAYFLPKNVDSTDLALLCGPGGQVEIEQNFMDRRLQSVTAYFGGLVMDPEDPDL